MTNEKLKLNFTSSIVMFATMTARIIGVVSHHSLDQTLIVTSDISTTDCSVLTATDCPIVAPVRQTQQSESRATGWWWWDRLYFADRG